MAHINIYDLPSIETLTPEEMEQIFGAGFRARPLSFESLENRTLFSVTTLSTITCPIGGAAQPAVVGSLNSQSVSAATGVLGGGATQISSPLTAAPASVKGNAAAAAPTYTISVGVTVSAQGGLTYTVSGLNAQNPGGWVKVWCYQPNGQPIFGGAFVGQ